MTLSRVIPLRMDTTGRDVCQTVQTEQSRRMSKAQPNETEFLATELMMIMGQGLHAYLDWLFHSRHDARV